jgi:S-phase kinase-associated protein 1
MDQEWYQNFVADENLTREMLFDLLTAANYMGIKPLLDLTCLKVTFQLTGKNAEEVSFELESSAVAIARSRTKENPRQTT